MPKGKYDRSKSKPNPRRGFDKDKDWLYNRYWNEDQSVVQIGAELGVTSSAIQYWMNKWGIPFRGANHPMYQERRKVTSFENRKYKHLTREYLQEHYDNKHKTLNQIAAEFGTSIDTVRKHIIRFGFSMAWDSRSHRVTTRRRTSTEMRRFQKIVIKEQGYACMVCGYDKFVNVHHIKPWSQTSDDTVENGIVLCPNHHSEADYGIISQEELRAIKINKTKSDTPRNGR